MSKEVYLTALVRPADYTRSHLPGLSLPVDFEPHARPRRFRGNDNIVMITVEPQGSGRDLMQTALSDAEIRSGFSSLPLLTLRELYMLRIMNDITDKPNWESKVFNEEIIAKWKSEIFGVDSLDISETMFEYIIAELQHRAKDFQQTGLYTVFNGDVVKSDVAIPESTKESLKKAVARLEKTTPKDWHPGSNETVLDLVHPSLFPLVYGRSRVLGDRTIALEECLSASGSGDVLKFPRWTCSTGRAAFVDWRNPRTTNRYSGRFQWLPCEVEFALDSRVKITSYINNLHPGRHRALYGLVEEIIARALPLWNLTVCPLSDRWSCMYGRPPRIPYHEVVYVQAPEEEKPQQGQDEDDVIFWDRQFKWENTQTVIQPEPPKFTPHQVRREERIGHADLRKDYEKEGLQVIVKLANIHLTPEKPTYEGGTWHVEGQRNEHIVATALYYYDSINITESRLAFRQGGEVDVQNFHYEQNHNNWMRQIYGCDPEGAVIQEIGSVLCKEGRLLTFPNTLQHRVQPFSLADATKPGHRKILALFLVDPNIRIISTANIPPQRNDWFCGEIARLNALGRLPGELQLDIVEMLEFPMGLDEAKAIREELMEERTEFVLNQNAAFASTMFSLCEH